MLLRVSKFQTRNSEPLVVRVVSKIPLCILIINVGHLSKYKSTTASTTSS